MTDMIPLRTSALILLIAVVGGCQSSDRAGGKDSHVIIRTSSTTEPIASPDESAARHVELTFRDATAAGIGQSLMGHSCIVQFRRDALGMANNAPMGPTQEWAGRTSVSGKIVEMTDQWLVIQPTDSARRYVIPQAAVLMIEVK